MYLKHKIGRKGEDIASIYLEKIGYKIIERNFRCKQGEIDIIAKDRNEIVFIEVKTRTNNLYGEPIEAVTEYKRNNILKTIKYYLYIHHLEKAFIRIDVIQIYIKSDKTYLNHMKKMIEG